MDDLIGQVLETEHGPYAIVGGVKWSDQYVELEAVNPPPLGAKYRTVRRTDQVRTTLGLQAPPREEEPEEEVVYKIPAPHPVGCECGNCSHDHYGCYVCGSKDAGCTPTSCATERAGRVVHCKKELFDVYIGRQPDGQLGWGNPYSHKEGTGAQHVVPTREDAVAAYRTWMEARLESGEEGLAELIRGLHGKTLGCWCAPQACHGDVLLDMANRLTTAPN